MGIIKDLIKGKKQEPNAEEIYSDAKINLRLVKRRYENKKKQIIKKRDALYNEAVDMQGDPDQHMYLNNRLKQIGSLEIFVARIDAGLVVADTFYTHIENRQLMSDMVTMTEEIENAIRGLNNLAPINLGKEEIKGLSALLAKETMKMDDLQIYMDELTHAMVPESTLGEVEEKVKAKVNDLYRQKMATGGSVEEKVKAAEQTYNV